MYSSLLKQFIHKKYNMICQMPIDDIYLYSSGDVRKSDIFQLCKEKNILPVRGYLIDDPRIVIFEVFKPHNCSHYCLNHYDMDWDNDAAVSANSIKGDMFSPTFLLQSDNEASILKYKLKY